MPAALSLMEVYARLRKAVAEAGGQSAFGRDHDLTPQQVSDAINARRSPGPAVLRAIGVRQRTVYEEAGP